MTHARPSALEGARAGSPLRPAVALALLCATLGCSRAPDAPAARPGEPPIESSEAPSAAQAEPDARLDGPPAAAIEWPAPGSAHRTVRMDVRGSARGVREVFVNGQPAAVGADGRWTADVELAAGEPELVVHAPPLGGAEPQQLAFLKLVVDLDAPLLTMDEPPGAELAGRPEARIVPAPTARLRGRVVDAWPGRPAALALDGEPRELAPDGAFELELALASEGDNAFKLEAEDAAGNQGRLALVLVRDTTPPELIVDAPSDEESVQLAPGPVVVRGRVVDAHPSALTADGEAVSLAADGSFELALELGEEPLRRVLVARDAAGNGSKPLELVLGGE